MPDLPLLSTRQVADILALEEARLRYWAQTGVVGPSIRRGGRQFYTFSDVVGVKATKDLCGRGLPLQRVRRAVEALRHAMPTAEKTPAVARLRVLSDGERVVVADEGTVYEPLTGQLVLDFALGQVSAAIAKVFPIAAPSPIVDGTVAPAGRPQAQTRAVESTDSTVQTTRTEDTATPGRPSTSLVLEMFLRGVTSQRRGDEASAEACYLKALALDPELAAAHTNLGSVYFSRGELDQARRAYECALAIDDGQAEARFNLANLLVAQEELARATSEYLDLLTRHPGYKDGHYNLAVLLEAQGDAQAARYHYGRYLELEGTSDRFTSQAKAALWRLGAIS